MFVLNIPQFFQPNCSHFHFFFNPTTMSFTATKKVPEPKPTSEVTPDKGIVRKTKPKRPNYKLKKKKPDKAPKVITARKGLTYAALTTAKVGSTLPPNPYKTNRSEERRVGKEC